MKEFKAGDKVVCDGIQGVVVLVNLDNHPYPVHVGFDDGICDNFTIEGKSFTMHDHPSLFHVGDSEAAPAKKKQKQAWIKVVVDNIHAYIRTETVHIVFQDDNRLFMIVADKGQVDVTGQYTLEELIDILGIDA